MPTLSIGTVAARRLPAKPNLEHLKNEAKQGLGQSGLETRARRLS
jgi:hypothetical protein